jgi:hypothetical protein
MNGNTATSEVGETGIGAPERTKNSARKTPMIELATAYETIADSLVGFIAHTRSCDHPNFRLEGFGERCHRTVTGQ